MIKSIANILDDLFKSENRPLVEVILREKIMARNSSSSSSGIQLYKIVNILLEEMTYGMENRPVEFLRLINH